MTLLVNLIKKYQKFSGRSLIFLLNGVITSSFVSCHLRKLGQKALAIRLRKPPPIYKNIATHSLSRKYILQSSPFFPLPFTFDPRRDVVSHSPTSISRDSPGTKQTQLGKPVRSGEESEAGAEAKFTRRELGAEKGSDGSTTPGYSSAFSLFLLRE